MILLQKMMKRKVKMMATASTTHQTLTSSATESDDGSDEDIRKFVVPDDYVSSAEESE